MTYSPRCVEKLFGNSELSRIGATKRPRGVKEVPIGCLLAPKKSARDTFCYFPNSFGRRILGSSASGHLVLVPATTPNCLRSRDQGAQPYPSRCVSGDDVAEVVHAKVHPADADQHHHKRRRVHAVPGEEPVD